MADNNEVLNKFKEMTSAEQFLQGIEGKADPFAGLSLQDLQELADKVNGFDNSKAKDAVAAMLNSEIAKQQNEQENASQNETDILDDMQFVTQSSYSQYKASSQPDNAKIVENAKKFVELADKQEITPESAVILKDYIDILNNSSLSADEKNKLKALESKVDEQLKIFDTENGIIDEKTGANTLEGISADELAAREYELYEIAGNINEKADETTQILTHLAVQELKLDDDAHIYRDIIQEVAKQTGIDREEIRAIYVKGRNGEKLDETENKCFTEMEKMRKAIAKRIFEDKIADLRNQFEATALLECVKLSAEELYPEKPGMSEQEKADIQAKREKYIDNWLQSGKNDTKHWVEENALRALKAKYPDVEEEKLKKDYAKEYAEMVEAYGRAADEISEATKTAFVAKADLLAGRTARLTDAPDISPQFKNFLQKFAEKNPKSYAAGKIGIAIGKSVALSTGMKAAFGFKGMAAYSAYNTRKVVKKSWEKYKQQAALNGKSANLAGFWGYLKDNPNERVNVVSGVAKTAIMSTLAVAGTALGFDNIPGVSAALVAATNAAATTAKAVYNRDKIKSGFKDLYTKAKNSSKFKKWGVLGLVGAGAAAAAYMLMSDETKEKIDESLGDALSEKDNNSADIAAKDSTIVATPNSDENMPNTNGTVEATPDLSAADAKLLITDCKMGPDPIVAKLQEMGVLSAEDKAKLIAVGGRKDGVASRVLASYLGHSYDGTEVPVHAELTAEQQQELTQYLRSQEYQQACDKCNAPANAAKLAELKEKINAQKSVETNTSSLTNQENEQTPIASKEAETAAASKETDTTKNQYVSKPEPKKADIEISRNKAFLGITTKHGVDVNNFQTASEDENYKTLRNAAIAQHLDNHDFKHMTATMTDEQGNTSTANVTVRGNSMEDMKIKTKILNSDGSTMKETMKLKDGIISATYENNVVKDVNNDGLPDKLVGKAQIGNTQFTAYKTSDGKDVLVESQRQNDGSFAEKSRAEVKNAKSKLNNIVNAARNSNGR